MTRILTSLFVFLAVTCSAQSIGDFRSIASGDWGDPNTWETWDGSAWVAATLPPTVSDETVTISNGHNVFLSADLTADQIVIASGGELVLAAVLTLNNGTGTDLTIDGILTENFAPVWSVNSTWSIGTAGTLVRSSSGMSNSWQLNYAGGILSIPATANWIIQRNAAIPIFLSSTTPSTGSVYPNLIIENNVSGNWVASSAFTGSLAAVTIKGTFDVGGAGSSTVEFEVDNTFSPCGIIFEGDVIVRPGNRLRNNGSGFIVKGNLTVDGTLSYSSTPDLRFQGTTTQTVSGTGTLDVANLYTQCGAGGDIVLARSLTVDNICTFGTGVITSSSSNLFILGSFATITPASATSYVNGPVRYQGTSNIIFPVGKNGFYRPVEINTSAIGTVWTVEYFNSDPNVFGTSIAPTLNHISECEYWSLVQTGTTTNSNVSLSWDANSCGVTLLSDLRIARWDGFATWIDCGNSNTTGTTSAGTVLSGNVLASFGLFTLASATTQNPLPVELLFFDAQWTGDAVDLNWSTASEQNNAFFTVEKSIDGEDFTEVLRVDGAGNSSTTIAYTAQDHDPLPGISYYRLKQTDYNGQASYSQIKMVDVQNKNNWQIENLLSTEQTIQLNLSAHELPLAVEVFSSTGQLVFKTNLPVGSNQLFLETSNWGAGYYTIRLRDGLHQHTRSIVR